MHLAVLTAAAVLVWPRPAPESLPRAVTPALLPAVPADASADAERVVVPTEDKLSLVGTYWAPKGKQIAPGAILIHAAGGNRSDLEDYARRLARLGFGVLSVDLRGHGESATPNLDWGKLDREGRERLWAFATRDVKACSEFLRSKRDVHSASLVLVGHGAGATLVTRHAVRDENVRAIALLDPPSEEQGMLGFHLEKDIEALGGLPTFISVSKETRTQAERLAANGSAANGGLQFIQISVFKGARSDVLTDSREAAEIVKWLKARALPGKGAR